MVLNAAGAVLKTVSDVGFVVVKTHLGGIPKVDEPPPVSVKKRVDGSNNHFLPTCSFLPALLRDQVASEL